MKPAAAVLGGTFNPIHFGHLRIARWVLARSGLERMLILPAAIPPHKDPAAHAPAEHRAAMVRRALAGQRGLELCTLELDDGGVCYTIDTLHRLRAESEIEPIFVIGMDSLYELPTWRSFRELMAGFDMIVVDRPGRSLDLHRDELHPEVAPRVQPLADLAEPLGTGGRILHLEMLPIRISSSEIRERAAAGRPLTGLVPPAVDRYIRRNRLYRQEDRP